MRTPVPAAAAALRAPGPSHPLLPPRIRQTARPPAGGRGDAPSGAPPGSEPPAGRPRPGAEEGAAEEQPEAPESEKSRRRPRRRRRRHCGEEGEEEREEGRAGWEKRKKSFETFPLPLGAGGAGTDWRGAAPPGGRTRGPQTASTTASDARSLPAPSTASPPGAPIPDQPSGAANPDSREDLTPDLGRTPLHAAPPTPSLSPEPPRIQGPFSSGIRETGSLSDLPQLPYSRPPTSGTRSRPSRFFSLGYRETTHQSLPSTSAPFSLRASAPPPPPRPSYLSSGDPQPL
ncbi:protein PRRC2A-like [Phoca vitulina]|uniref:protein PRRC2A-like n=1 Tax=Phoca vitulina TaxID=9720 RepID=UPI0013960C00|nr:protein PRRC2A-like [Phoca vitulina]